MDFILYHSNVIAIVVLFLLLVITVIRKWNWWAQFLVFGIILMTPVLFYDYMLYLIGILVLFELFLLKAKARVVSIEIDTMIDEALERDVFVGKAVCVSKEPKVVFENHEKEVGLKERSEPIVAPKVEVKEPEVEAVETIIEPIVVPSVEVKVDTVLTEPEAKAESSYANITKAYDYGERKRKRLERILNKR